MNGTVRKCPWREPGVNGGKRITPYIINHCKPADNGNAQATTGNSEPSVIIMIALKPGSSLTASLAAVCAQSASPYAATSMKQEEGKKQVELKH